MFPGALPVWWEPWEVLFSQDAPGRLLVPQTVSALQGVPAPTLQIPHQEIQVGSDVISTDTQKKHCPGVTISHETMALFTLQPQIIHQSGLMKIRFQEL